MSTLRERVCEAGASTLREYLCSPVTSGLGSFIPYDSLKLNVRPSKLEVNIEKRILEIDIQKRDIELSGAEDLSINIQNPRKEIDHECN